MTQTIHKTALPVSEVSGPVTAQIISLSDMHAPSNPEVSPIVAFAGLDEANPLHQVKATLNVCVGSVVLTVGELLKAKKEQVIRLDSTIHDPVELLIEGKVVARGQLVAIDNHFAVCITDLPQALKV